MSSSFGTKKLVWLGVVGSGGCGLHSVVIIPDRQKMYFFINFFAASYTEIFNFLYYLI